MVRHKITQEPIITIDKIVFVSVDAEGKPAPHGRTKIHYTDERLREDE